MRVGCKQLVFFNTSLCHAPYAVASAMQRERIAQMHFEGSIINPVKLARRQL